MNIKDKVKEYDILRLQAKTIKSRMDSLSKEIKKYLTENVPVNAKGSYYSEDDDYVYGNVARKSIKINEDKAKQFFQERNLLEEVTDVKVVVNEDKVAKLLQDEVITQEDLESIVDVKVTYSIDVKAKEHEKEEEIVEVVETRPKRKLPTRR